MPGFIRRRSKGSWEVTVELGRDAANGRRIRRTQTVKGTRRDAERVQATLLLQAESGIDLEPERLTVAAFLDRWLTAVRPNLAPATFRLYVGLVKSQIDPGLGAVPLTKLRPLHVQTLYARLQQSGRADGKGGLSARTVLHAHRLLSEALRQAVRWQMLPRNVCDAVEPPQPRRVEMHTLNNEQVRLLLAVAEARNDGHGDAIALAVHTGMRMGELLGLHWDDVNLDRGYLTVRLALQKLPGSEFEFREPKTARSRRRIPIGASAVSILRRTRMRQLEQRMSQGLAWHDMALVLSYPTGSPLSGHGLLAAFRWSLGRAGLPRVRFHDLRHTHASLLLERGVHPKIVSERLGHASIAITMDTYSHVLPSLQEDAVRDFDAWLVGPGDERSVKDG